MADREEITICLFYWKQKHKYKFERMVDYYDRMDKELYEGFTRKKDDLCRHDRLLL